MLHLQVKPLSLMKNVIYLQQDNLFAFPNFTYTRNHSRQPQATSTTQRLDTRLKLRLVLHHELHPNT